MKENNEDLKASPDYLFEESVNLAHAALLNSIAIHEITAHEGEICWDERKNLAAYLYTCLGLESTDLKQFKEAVIHHELQDEDDEEEAQTEEEDILNATELTVN